MSYRAKLSLTISECHRAEEMGCEVVKGTSSDYEHGLLEGTKVMHNSVTHLIKFLKSISDLRGYSDEELEESYIRKL